MVLNPCKECNKRSAEAAYETNDQSFGYWCCKCNTCNNRTKQASTKTSAINTWNKENPDWDKRSILFGGTDVQYTSRIPSYKKLKSTSGLKCYPCLECCVSPKMEHYDNQEVQIRLHYVMCPKCKKETDHNRDIEKVFSEWQHYNSPYNRPYPKLDEQPTVANPGQMRILINTIGDLARQINFMSKKLDELKGAKDGD